MRSKNAIKNIATNLLLQIVVLLYGFIVPKIIISNFGSNVNGLISSINQFLGYIVLLESGFGPVVTASLYKPIAQKNKDEIANILYTAERFFKKISYIFISYIIIMCLLFPLIVSNDFSYVYTFLLIIIISISTFAEYFFGMTYKLFLQANQKLYIISLVQIITYIISITITIILTVLNSNIHIIKLLSGLIFVIRPIFLNIYVKRKYAISFEKIDKNYKLKQKWDGLAQHIAAVIHSNTDVTLLTLFTNLSEVSVYSVYFLVVKGLKSLIQSFTGGLDSTFGDMIARKEIDNLNKKFDLYEILYTTICTILFSCAIILIVPFVTVYTYGINDAQYIRYSFGSLIVISEFIWAIRLPYSSITLAAGHFKETRVGAWIECFTNIIISIVLVWKFGIVGVTIGTIVAMTIRTIEFIYHTNKIILHRSLFFSLKKIGIVIIDTIIVVLICRFIPYFDNISYFNWIINSIMVLLVSFIVTFSINSIIYKDKIKDIFTIVNIIK